MKNALSTMLLLALLGCMSSAVLAAELLEVKPVVAGNTVSVEITADIPMTYTYYKVPGQARAVVDIAEADPEKVEPLIVVNKGAVSSISVDKAQISGIVVSRIIFNLVAESDISATASADRKQLTVVFAGAAGKPEPKAEPAPAPVPEPIAKAEPAAAATEPPPAAAAPEEDPLGLNEPAAKSAAAPASAAVTAAAAPLLAAPTITRVPKLEPVVPVSVTPARTSALSIQEIASGDSYIDIRTNQSVKDYKVIKLSGPDRLVLDIASDKINQKAKSVTINKFGIAKARIGISPKNIRIVFDSMKAGIPAHTVTTTEDGLRITFK